MRMTTQRRRMDVITSCVGFAQFNLTNHEIKVIVRKYHYRESALMFNIVQHWQNLNFKWL